MEFYPEDNNSLQISFLGLWGGAGVVVCASENRAWALVCDLEQVGSGPPLFHL